MPIYILKGPVAERSAGHNFGDGCATLLLPSVPNKRANSTHADEDRSLVLAEHQINVAIQETSNRGAMMTNMLII